MKLFEQHVNSVQDLVLHYKLPACK